jgi:hypothetical protein
MNRVAFLGLVVCLGLALPSLAGIPTDYFTLSRSGHKEVAKYEYVGVQRGRIVVASSRFMTFDEERPNQWFVRDGKIKSRATGEYLAYDVSGKDVHVFLTAKPGEGAQWLLLPHGKPSREEEHGTIQAAAGPLKGWYLDIEEREEVPEGGDKAIPVRRLVLAKEPARGFEAWRVYQHK